jgi:DNA-binding NarL/FixJ family response regulator
MPRKTFSTVETSLGSRSNSSSPPNSTTEISASTISLVLAGHHPLTLCGLSQVFAREGDCSIVATCTDSDSTLGAVRFHQPDILILDVDLPRNGAFTLLRRMRRQQLSTRVILLAAAADNGQILDAIQVGIQAVVLKEMAPEAFVTCVRKVHRGEQCLDGHDLGRMTGRLSRGRSALHELSRHLTPREMEIARIAIQGLPTRDIASRLGLKQGTVKIHLHSIYDKLNVDGRLGLMLSARRHGFI